MSSRIVHAMAVSWSTRSGHIDTHGFSRDEQERTVQSERLPQVGQYEAVARGLQSGCHRLCHHHEATAYIIPSCLSTIFFPRITNQTKSPSCIVSQLLALEERAVFKFIEAYGCCCPRIVATMLSYARLPAAISTVPLSVPSSVTSTLPEVSKNRASSTFYICLPTAPADTAGYRGTSIVRFLSLLFCDRDCCVVRSKLVI